MSRPRAARSGPVGALRSRGVRPGGHTCIGRLKRAATRSPTPSSFWLAAARDAGFADVTYVPLQEGAGIMLARKRWETAHSEVE